MQYKEHIYGKEDRVFFYNKGIEVDFYHYLGWRKDNFREWIGYRSSACLKMVAAVVKLIAAIQTGITPLYKICWEIIYPLKNAYSSMRLHVITLKAVSSGIVLIG